MTIKRLPVKDENDKTIYKNKIKWTPSSKNKKLAEIELGKYEQDKDRGRIGLDKKHTSWQDIKSRYLLYSKATKAKTSFLLDKLLFEKIEEFYPSISSINDLNMSFAEKIFELVKRGKASLRRDLRKKVFYA